MLDPCCCYVWILVLLLLFWIIVVCSLSKASISPPEKGLFLVHVCLSVSLFELLLAPLLLSVLSLLVFIHLLFFLFYLFFLFAFLFSLPASPLEMAIWWRATCERLLDVFLSVCDFYYAFQPFPFDWLMLCCFAVVIGDVLVVLVLVGLHRFMVLSFGYVGTLLVLSCSFVVLLFSCRD